MGRRPAVDLNIIPVRVAAPTELNSSSSPPRNLPINVSRLQYIRAVHKTSNTQLANKGKWRNLFVYLFLLFTFPPSWIGSLPYPNTFCQYLSKYSWEKRSTGREVLNVLGGVSCWGLSNVGKPGQGTPTSTNITWPHYQAQTGWASHMKKPPLHQNYHHCDVRQTHTQVHVCWIKTQGTRPNAKCWQLHHCATAWLFYKLPNFTFINNICCKL